MGVHLPHPNSHNGRNARYHVILVSPETVSVYAGANVNSSITEKIEGAINSELDRVADAGGHVLHIDYNMSQNAMFFAAITVLTADPVTYAEGKK